MIITRTPLRVSFTGGGCDLRSFYKNEPGLIISTTIDKYIYTTIKDSFTPEAATLNYGTVETYGSHGEIQHPILRELLAKEQLHGLDVHSISDLPFGTGLGSSSSFTVGMLNGIGAYKKSKRSKEFLANEASVIEIEKVKEPIGKQDQYAAAYGGLNAFSFNPDESVTVTPIPLGDAAQSRFEENLMMFYTKKQRAASSILSEQKKKTESDRKTVGNLRKMSELSKELWDLLKREEFDAIGELLHRAWCYKRELTASIANDTINNYYEVAMNNGALGGKLLGAGGGGFLLFYVPKENQDRVRSALHALPELTFSFDRHGSQIIHNNGVAQ